MDPDDFDPASGAETGEHPHPRAADDPVADGRGGPDHTGRLLVATPALDEGIFRRAVVLVLHHDEEGAQGVVLDKPADADVDRVLPGWGEHVSAPATLFHGGPVGEDSALGIVSVPGTDPEPLGVRHLFGSIGLVDLDTPPPVVVPHIAGLRIFAGYSGWSEGQLEGEVAAHAWYVVDAEPSDLFTPEPGRLWREVLARQAGRLSLVALFPDDPDLN